MKPRKIIQIDPICKNFLLKITMLKSLMNCGELWGAYHQGWAMMRDQEDCIFPFWLNPLDAKNYAQQHWPDYIPRKINSEDFENALLPTLSRLNVTPALFNTNGTKLKLTAAQMRHLFFSQQRLHIA
ncbi:MAG: hypothetical protein ACD_6C00572G0003 [uncultured bacterium]|jgi:Protein of unknown function (DUF2750)|uniref:DUF2750 domain-containing protein n=2 Tax=Acinetobacter lwoffii TaxID=28090 RepID=A0A3D0T934_ACILW|nr:MULTISPECIES: DUF2750 domain-containing protein [Acinetobacter]EKE23171.1 MAG: hypothetical protein ACD_6C00572G0003 [uncultured bacterium]KGH51162.1 hypothetical protein GS19_03345 [Acinetobacter idrijaensis]ODN54047.1 hypothetical protein A9Z54_04610 [Acinetobacter sp. 51m]EEY90605.1 hypothetical protein HMPREF0017_00375 [Acinetobacter lwoffii SH145]ENU62426.1 hypothetical protein F980_01752 [Acinetobacter lwoffii NIPH 715]